MKLFIPALIEAWLETKVQKVRVIISLIGVVAAVAAMSLVIAIGNVAIHSLEETIVANGGREATIDVTVTPAGQQQSQLPFGMTVPTKTTEDAQFDVHGKPEDPVGDAMLNTVKTYKVRYFSRVQRTQANITAYETSNTQVNIPFGGGSVNVSNNPISVLAVDPGYQVIFRQAMVEGRYLRNSDVELRSNPTVINESLWKKALNNKPLSQNPQIKVRKSDGTTVAFTVVGVVKDSLISMDTMFIPYEAFPYTLGASATNPSLLVWTSKEEAPTAQKSLRDAVAAAVGNDYTVSATGGDAGAMASSLTGTATGVFTTVMSIIGAIVIGLGSLGLLNVAVVTVRQRVREIGIRRALGASAKRIFFAVFLESVVATSLAGVLGVVIAIIIFRVVPLDTYGIVLLEQPGFPMSAAMVGVGVSTAVGALCGLIPAIAAVRIKPIEAIRY